MTDRRRVITVITMRTQLVRIGNSRGVRLPQNLLSLYRLKEGDEFELEERQEGILLRPARSDREKLSWEASYAEMAAEPEEAAEWADWDLPLDERNP